MKEMPFFVNPQGKRVHARLVAGKTARQRRPVRRAKTGRTNAATTGVKTMAKKRHRRPIRRRNPPRHHVTHHHKRRRHRRNPAGLNMNGILRTVTGGVMDAAWGVGGKASARAASTKLGFVPGSMTSMLVEAGVGVLGAMVLRKFAPSGTRAFLQGAFMAPIETFVISNNVPVLATYLGDYNTGTLPIAGMYNAGAVNPGRQAGAFNGYPAQLSGYPAPVGHMSGFADDTMGDFDTMAGTYR
jgi:hypothetical protein